MVTQQSEKGEYSLKLVEYDDLYMNCYIYEWPHNKVVVTEVHNPPDCYFTVKHNGKMVYEGERHSNVLDQVDNIVGQDNIAMLHKDLR